MGTVRDYYRVTKPGIVYGNVIHAVAGILIAYHFGLTWPKVLATVAGIGLLIASACVANNILDRDIDKAMHRTKRRELVTGRIAKKSALLYAVVLGAVALTLLALFTNPLTCLLGVVAYVWYVFIYGYAKRTTWLSTLVGTVPGALPVMAGYTAISGVADGTAWLLFLLLVAWQMPHFYAIGIFRRAEYKQARLPIATNRLTMAAVFAQMIVWGIVYVGCAISLSGTSGIHWLASWLLVLSGLLWLRTMLQGYGKYGDKWARTVFKQSLIFPFLLVAAGVLTIVLP